MTKEHGLSCSSFDEKGVVKRRVSGEAQLLTSQAARNLMILIHPSVTLSKHNTDASS